MNTNPATETEAEPRPPLFKVGGEAFECVSFVPQWNMMRLAAAMESGDEMQGMAAMYRFVMRIVKPHEHERLEVHMDSLDIEHSDLDNAIGDVLVEMAGRGKVSGPPKGIRPSDSSSGSSSGGSPETPPTHLVVSLSQGTVRPAPPATESSTD